MIGKKVLFRFVRVVLTTAFVAVSVLVSTVPLRAQSDGPAQGIQISPVLVELNADKNRSYTLTLTVTNVTAGTLDLTSEVNDFRAKDETGNPEVIIGGEPDNASYSFAQWVEPIPDITLKSKESRVITAEVNVPDNAEAGGHYGVIRFSGTPPGQSPDNVSMSASVGCLVLTRVAGEINESLDLSDLFVAQNDQEGGTFERGPVNIVERITNTGNVHLKPVGNAVVKNMFGKTIASLQINNTGGNVLPDSTRRFEQTLENKNMLGRYSVEVDMAYGTTGGVLLGNTTFWVIPYKLIILLLVIIALLIWLSRRGLKRYHKRIIRKAGQHNSRR